jgi:glycosyltransferase involved in cell wall biosynthesis
MRVVFLDISCPAPYDAETLKTRPQGGTESTVTRVAERLAEHGYDAIVAQHNRTDLGVGKATYCSFEALEGMRFTPEVVVGLRTTRLIPFIENNYRTARRFLWMHDLNVHELIKDYPLIENTQIKILGVSRYHKQQISSALLSQVGDVRGVTVGMVYNPIDDELTPHTGRVIPKQLIFNSSPNKGLQQTLYLFERLRSIDPEYTLAVANPGYLPDMQGLPEGAFSLGNLPHPEMLKHVAESALLFHMNKVFPETFGLVYAEASAVGTPSLTSRVGAVHEVLGPDKYQYVDVTDERAVIERVQLRTANRPTPIAKPEFRMSKVIEDWKGIINV